MRAVGRAHLRLRLASLQSSGTSRAASLGTVEHASGLLAPLAGGDPLWSVTYTSSVEQVAEQEQAATLGARRYVAVSDRDGAFGFRFASLPPGGGSLTAGGASVPVGYQGAPIGGLRLVVGD